MTEACTMRRESKVEISPGEFRHDVWVLRTEDGTLVDWDQYRVDMELRADRLGFVITSTEKPTMTADEAIAIVRNKASGRTRFEGQEPYLDEVLVAEIERLRKDRMRVYEWMREPDNIDNANLDWLLKWVNRRPCSMTA